MTWVSSQGQVNDGSPDNHCWLTIYKTKHFEVDSSGFQIDIYCSFPNPLQNDRLSSLPGYHTCIKCRLGGWVCWQMFSGWHHDMISGSFPFNRTCIIHKYVYKYNDIYIYTHSFTYYRCLWEYVYVHCKCRYVYKHLYVYSTCPYMHKHLMQVYHVPNPTQGIF